MAEISDEQFKSEMLDFKSDVLAFIKVANQKFDGLTADVRSNGFRLDRIENKLEGVEIRLGNVENRLDRVENKVDKMDAELTTLSHQFSDVARTQIREIDAVKARVDVIEGTAH